MPDPTSVETLELTAAETRVWEAYPTGTMVVLGENRPDEPLPERTVRAEVISRLLLGAREGRPGHVPAVKLRGAYIRGRLRLSGGTIECELRLERCHFDEVPDLSNARTRQLRMSECRMPGLDAGGLQADGYVSLSRSRIDGEVRLQRAQISGGLRMNDVIVTQSDPNRWALFGGGLVVDAGAFLRDAEFNGGVRLVGARMNGGLFMEGALLCNPSGPALDAQNIVVEDAAEFSAGFIAEGMVRLRGAKVHGTLSFDLATLRAGTDPRALQATLMQVEEMLFRPTEPVNGRVALSYSHIGTLRDGGPMVWPRELWLRGLTYDALRGCPPEERLRWVGREEYHPQPYEQLASWYRQIGHEDLARKAMLAKMRARRRTLSLPARIWSHLLDWTIGHGYRPWMAAVWVALLLIAGTVVFSVEPPRSIRPPEERPHYNAFIYTLDLLIPIGTFGRRELFDPVGWTEWVAYVLIASGWILVTALIAGATRVLRPNA
ncbi:hypothetical protein [Thermomonospora sp. CIF 1]|uniref:hypothetical protein n=1 Tax=Thermomonospora sp. CIF 1 TaxID=1916083 RepID=UPI000A4E523F|nr:hypothetical protein [Thermomonospora sp. CIF 1]PKK16120.1 MAG: hypothetical protein BUE48_001335 [Thermomonospora sp. CIF 1]